MIVYSKYCLIPFESFHFGNTKRSRSHCGRAKQSKATNSIYEHGGCWCSYSLQGAIASLLEWRKTKASNLFYSIVYPAVIEINEIDFQ